MIDGIGVSMTLVHFDPRFENERGTPPGIWKDVKGKGLREGAFVRA
jgi:hypothetical protein